MRDRGLIYAGLVIFLGAVTSPFSYYLVSGSAPREPQLSLPKGVQECVAPVEYMKRYHMRLLLEWRDGVVRKDRRSYTAPGGQVYRVSLSGTCLSQCHTNKAEFCDRCHTYLGVHGPDCMNCHVDPRSAERKSK